MIAEIERVHWSRDEVRGAADVFVNELHRVGQFKRPGDVPVEWLYDATGRDEEPFISEVLWVVGGTIADDHDRRASRVEPRGLPLVTLTDHGRSVHRALGRNRSVSELDLMKSIAGWGMRGRRAAFYLAKPGDPLYAASRLHRAEQAVNSVASNIRKVRRDALGGTLAPDDTLRVARLLSQSAMAFGSAVTDLIDEAQSRRLLGPGD